MQDEQWKEVVTRIQDSFHVLTHEVISGDDVSGDVEVLEFESPQGKMKLERVSKPRVIGKSAISSKRIGGSSAVKYEYSSTEKIHTVTASRWNESSQDWQTIDYKGGM